jgi:uncharacterized protein with HEPN domain
MVDAARKIQLYVQGLSFEDFTKDEKTFDAVIRQLTVIGEAASHVPDEIASRERNIPQSVIRGMRNIVVHEYFGVDASIIWKTVLRNIPELRSQVKELQQKLSQG